MNGQMSSTPPEQIFTSLQEMRLGIEQLVETDQARRDEMQFLADIRDKIAQGLTILHDQLMEVRKEVATVEKEVKILRIPPAQKPAPKWWKQQGFLLHWGGGVMVGIVLMAGAWAVSPATSRERFAVEMNSVLDKAYGQLPKAVQEQIRAVYRRYNFLEPGHK